MPKRKPSAPQRADETKRQLLSWNMMDDPASLHVVSDNNQSLIQEINQSDALLSAEENKSQAGTSQSEALQWIDHNHDDRKLEEFLNYCDFFLPVQTAISTNGKTKTCHLGTFQIKLLLKDELSPHVIASVNEFWFYVSKQSEKSMVYFEMTGNEENIDPASRAVFFAADASFPYSCLESLQIKVFHLVLAGYDQDTASMQIDIHILDSAFIVPQFASEGARPRKSNLAVQQIMAELYGYSIPSYLGSVKTKKHDIENFYEVIRLRHENEDTTWWQGVEVQHSSLLPVLRPYQKSAVRWMLQKENFQPCPEDSKSSGTTGAVYSSELNIHSLWDEFRTPCGQLLYYNKYAGSFTKENQLFMDSPPGGILADEMGLGKTVEVLACMLLHPRPGFEEKASVSVNNMKCTAEWDESNLTYDTVTNMNNACKSSESKSLNETESCSPNLSQQEGRDSNDKSPTTKCADICDIMHEHNYMYPPPDGAASRYDTTDVTGTDNEEAFHYDHMYSEKENPIKQDSLTKASSSSQSSLLGTDSLDMPATSASGSGKNLEHNHVEIETKKVNSDDTVSQPETSQTIEKESASKPAENCHIEQRDNVSKDEKNVSEINRTVTGDHTKDVSGANVKKDVFGSPTGPKQYFECICGTKDSKVGDKMRVQCEKCGSLQHPECVNFDLSLLEKGPYVCPHCLVASNPVPSGATLIISPNSICHQWVEEISKHIKHQHLKVFVYTGVTKQGFIQPRTLGDHHIVITTYETLRKEIDYVDLPHTNSEAGRRFRHPKRFMAVPSPMIAVEWWRICLDEAQMVECTTTKTAEMALRLTAVNRWCVTGTPIQRSLDDLYGLVLFLRLDPYWVRHWWTTLLFDPYCYGNQQKLTDVVADVLWRTAKKDVIDQIDLPAQLEEYHMLQFSPVEEHFYRRQYQDCTRISTQELSKWTQSSLRLNTLDRHTLHKLLYPLTRLRQACCHPQAVRGEFLPIHKSTLTMEELLKSLIKKVKTECEEAHRQKVAALNAQAGLFIIQSKFVEAVEKYREVLQSVEEHKDRVGTDKLQLLHTLCNLDEVLQAKHENVPPTLRDDQLKKQASELRDKYLVKAAAFVASNQEAEIPARRNVRELQHEFKRGRGWWAELIHWVDYINMDEELTLKIREELSEHSNNKMNSIARRFRNLTGLELILNLQLEQLQTSRDNLIEALQGVRGEPSREMINHTVECCLRPEAEIKKNCPFCQVDELFQDYEGRLFLFVEKGTNLTADEEDTFHYLTSSRRQGTWADSEAERALKILISFCRNARGNRELIEYGSLHIRIFEALKKEFRSLRSVWISLKERVSVIDELDMAAMRFRLRLPHEPVTDPPLSYILEETELEQFRVKQLSDEAVGRNELRKKLGQLMYLTNLAKTQDDQESGDSPEPCPICKRTLGKEWSVLQCGHCFCLECIRIMVDQYSFGGVHRSLKCAICRQRTYHAEICYVSTKCKQDMEDSSGIKVKGDHSTKVEGVVRCLLQIQETDPGAKALIFSTWQDVLDIVAEALEQNGIEFKSLHSHNKYQANLSSFKHEEQVTALLLPVHSGANGLNLIEATHVLLVEPILNLAQEQQAVGRVHRIGQTKKTVIHRFLVRGTIEERMHNLLKTVQTPVNSHNNEETMLTIADLTSLFQEQEEEDAPSTDVNVVQNRQLLGFHGNHMPAGEPQAGASSSMETNQNS